MGDILDYDTNLDEVYLEFLSRYDSDSLLKTENDDMIRDKSEINAMINNYKPAEITKSILFSKKDYVSQFKILKEPEPEMGCLVESLNLEKSITSYLKESGIHQFYKFQEEAMRKILNKQSIVIEAPTASGKTEAFLIPIIHNVKKSQQGSVLAVFVYPTKSLSRDQLPIIQKLAGSVGVTADVFDGDTPYLKRSEILANPPDILVTNFDILHYHLWHKTKFASMISMTETFVVDETHIYTGIFGSNVHYILKRLQRICKKNLQFIAASATLNNAKTFCEDLFGVPMQLVRGSGRKGEVDFAMLFPSLRTPRSLMVDLTKRLVEKNHKTMVFSNSHINSEMLAIQARRQKINIKVHRAGLMSNYRKLVEKEFKDGSLSAISCTPTLELGINVGDVDGVISSPVSVNRLVQRIGRAARKGQRGFAFLVLGNDPISQYYKNHPDDYFEDVEYSYIDAKNPFVERLQILAMACDKPLLLNELPEHHQIIQQHLDKGNLLVQGDHIIANRKRAVSILEKYSIRGIGGSIDILLDGVKVGERILPIALDELHKDAIYFLAGTRYRVSSLSYPEYNYAKLARIPKDYPYYTKALTEEWPTIQKIHEKRQVFGMEVAFCDLLIRKNVYGYANVELGQDVAQGQKITLDTPLEYNLVTKGIIFCAPRPTEEIQKGDSEEYVEVSGYHATEHVVIEGSNMITGGASRDLGGISMGNSGLIFVYDGAIGGNGASRALYDRLEKALKRSMRIVIECPCKNMSGCPRCTFSYRCGNNNEFLHKNSCIEILRRITSGEKTKVTSPSEDDRPFV